MTIHTVADLIAALQKLPDDMRVGTNAGDYVGDKFEETVRLDTEYVNLRSGRTNRAESGEGVEQVLVIR